MNKILRLALSLALSTFGAMAYAQEAIFDWSGVTTTTVASSQNVYTSVPITLTFDKGTGSNWPSENKEGSIRMYTNSTLTIKAADGYVITKVVFTPVSPTYSASNLAYDEKAISDDWTVPTPASEILLTGKQNVRLKKIVVSYTATSSDVVTAPSITGTTPFVGSTTVTLTAATGSSVYYTTDGTDPTNASTLYTAPFTLNASATVKAIAYKGATPSLVATKEFSAAYNASDIAGFKAQVDGTVQNLTLNNAKVLYADETNRYVYVKDETGAICFYNAGLGLTTGDVLNGSVAGELSIFNNMPQFRANSLTNKDKLTQSTGTPEEPIAATVAELLSDKYLCNLVKISGVKLDSAGSNLYAYQGDAQIQIYDQFKKLAGVQIVKGNENNIVTGILVVYKDTYEIYPITVDGIVTTAITDLKADSAKAQAPVYNLAGQRVDAAYKGVVIQNGKKFIQR